MTDGTRAEVNLSSALRLGVVTGLTMAASVEGAPWIFALVDVPVGTDVVALERREGEWTVRGRQTVDLELARVSAEAASGRWEMVYTASPSAGRSTLYSQDWRITP